MSTPPPSAPSVPHGTAAATAAAAAVGMRGSPRKERGTTRIPAPSPTQKSPGPSAAVGVGGAGADGGIRFVSPPSGAAAEAEVGPDGSGAAAVSNAFHQLSPGTLRLLESVRSNSGSRTMPGSRLPRPFQRHNSPSSSLSAKAEDAPPVALPNVGPARLAYDGGGAAAAAAAGDSAPAQLVE
jgi:hypothetical protein